MSAILLLALLAVLFAIEVFLGVQARDLAYRLGAGAGTIALPLAVGGVWALLVIGVGRLIGRSPGYWSQFRWAAILVASLMLASEVYFLSGAAF